MTPSEKVALGKALETLERPRAEERVGGRPPKTAGNLPQVSGQTGRVREIVGEAIGMSGRTFAGVRPRRQPSPAQLAALAKARLQRPARA